MKSVFAQPKVAGILDDPIGEASKLITDSPAYKESQKIMGSATDAMASVNDFVKTIGAVFKSQQQTWTEVLTDVPAFYKQFRADYDGIRRVAKTLKYVAIGSGVAVATVFTYFVAKKA